MKDEQEIKVMEIKKELSEISNNWRVIPGLESYAINEDGVIKALPKVREGRLDCLNSHKGCIEKSQRKYKEHPIKQHFTSRYWYVSLIHNGIKKSYRVHRLVYKTFIGDIPKNMVIDHIDGNRNNNNINNLRCVTLSENCQNPNTKYNKSRSIVQIDKNSGKVINTFKNITDAETYITKGYLVGKQQGHIGECCKGKRRTAYGFFWQFEDAVKENSLCIKKDYRKGILQFNKDDMIVGDYNSIKEAAESNNYSASCIQKCAVGILKSYKNYKWKYK